MDNYLKNQILGSKHIEVPPHGVLDFRRGEHDLVFISAEYEAITYSDHPLASEFDLRFELLEEIGRVFIMGEFGDELFLFDAQRPGFRISHKLEHRRDGDRGFMWTHLVRKDTRLLLIYESGALCLNTDGEVLWSLPEINYGWDLVDVTDDTLILRDQESQHRRYSLLHGTEIKRAD